MLFSAILRERPSGLQVWIMLPVWFALHCPLIPALAQVEEDVFMEEELDAAAAPADEADAPEPAAAASPAESSTGADRTNYLQWAGRSLGIGYSLVFLTISFVLVALFVMSLLAARRENVVPVALIEQFETHVSENRFQEAYDLAKNDESMLGQVLAAGMSKLKVGYAQAIEAMQEVGEEENMKLEHRLSYMALIGTISPMIGLLGTVQGIIGAFQVIENTATGAPDAQELAGELSTALFTTLVGLALAIPAIAVYNILRNRVARLVLEVGIVSEGLMSRFQSMAPGTGPAAPKKS